MRVGADETYMDGAIRLAAAAPRTSPNPRVGAVVVSGGRVVGRAAHLGAGTPHAESLALRAAGPSARGATLYVNLEPCNHHGRTPPCVEAILAGGIARVVIGTLDPDPRVSGSGYRALQEAGLDVALGVLEPEAVAVNEAYIHHRRTGRPLVRMKLALSIDGRMAAPDGSSRWITGRGARSRVHALRARCDCVVVGSETVLIDDPDLRVRNLGSVSCPAAVVLDARGRVPAGARLFGTDREVLIATAHAPHEVRTEWKEAGAEVLDFVSDGRGIPLDDLVVELGRRGKLEILCEGGATVATALLSAGLVDLLEIHRGAVVIGGPGAAPDPPGPGTMASAQRWSLRDTWRMEDDVISMYEPSVESS